MRRIWVVPLALAAAVGAVAVYAAGGQPGPEAAVLAGDNLRARTGEHLRLSAVSTALAVAVALPAGLAITRRAGRRLAPAVLWVATLGQTVPTVAVLALMFTVTGKGAGTAVLALWAYSLLPVVRNTLAGVGGVDPAVTEAARGMGLRPAQVLMRVELPLAWPVILSGIRTAVVVNVGTASLATFVGAGGLGQVIQTGIVNQRDRILLVGTALTAIVALAADWLVEIVGQGPVRRLMRRPG